MCLSFPTFVCFTFSLTVPSFVFFTLLLFIFRLHLIVVPLTLHHLILFHVFFHHVPLILSSAVSLRLNIKSEVLQLFSLFFSLYFSFHFHKSFRVSFLQIHFQSFSLCFSSHVLFTYSSSSSYIKLSSFSRFFSMSNSPPCPISSSLTLQHTAFSSSKPYIYFYFPSDFLYNFVASSSLTRFLYFFPSFFF